MSRLGYVLGGALLGAVGLGLAAYLTDKYADSSSTDASGLDFDDEIHLEAHCADEQATHGEAQAEAPA